MALGLLCLRLEYYLFLGMESPSGGSSPMGFIIGAIVTGFFAIPALGFLVILYWKIKTDSKIQYLRIALVALVLVANIWVITPGFINIYKENQKYFHHKLYTQDVIDEINSRFNYKFYRLDSAQFTPGIEYYSERIEKCKLDTTGFHTQNNINDLNTKLDWLSQFKSLTIDPNGGWSSSGKPKIDINQYAFSDSTKIENNFKWSVLFYNKESCTLIATWTKE